MSRNLEKMGTSDIAVQTLVSQYEKTMEPTLQNALRNIAEFASATMQRIERLEEENRLVHKRTVLYDARIRMPERKNKKRRLTEKHPQPKYKDRLISSTHEPALFFTQSPNNSTLSCKSHIPISLTETIPKKQQYPAPWKLSQEDNVEVVKITDDDANKDVAYPSADYSGERYINDDNQYRKDGFQFAKNYEAKREKRLPKLIYLPHSQIIKGQESQYSANLSDSRFNQHQLENNRDIKQCKKSDTPILKLFPDMKRIQFDSLKTVETSDNTKSLSYVTVRKLTSTAIFKPNLHTVNNIKNSLTKSHSHYQGCSSNLPELIVEVESYAADTLATWKCTLPTKEFEKNAKEYILLALFPDELNGKPPKVDKAQWKRIGSMKFLPLPIKCTLNQTFGVEQFYFCVTSVDQEKHIGKFSNACLIKTKLNKTVNM